MIKKDIEKYLKYHTQQLELYVDDIIRFDKKASLCELLYEAKERIWDMYNDIDMEYGVYKATLYDMFKRAEKLCEDINDYLALAKHN